MKKRILSAVMCLTLAFITAFSFAGCGTTKRAGDITIWWPGGSEAERAAIEKAKEQYEALNDGIKIKIVPQQTSNFYMAYNLALDGNDYPDMAYVDHVYVQQLAYSPTGKSKIADLTSSISDIKDKFIDSLLPPNTLNGKTYAMPFSANTLVTVTNKTLLKTVLGRDVTDADIPKTYSQLKAISQKILDYNKAHNTSYVPFTIPAGNGNESMGAMAFLSYVAREGGTVISDDLKTMQLTDGPALNAATKIKELGASYGVPSSFGEGQFENGNIAFIEMGSWKIEEYERIGRQKNIDFGYSPVVKLKDDGEAISGLGLYSVVVTEKSINRDISIDFLKWLSTNEELQLLHNKPQGLMPTLKTAITDEFYKGGVWDVYTNQLNKIVARPGSPEWAEMERQFAGFVTALLNGSREPAYVNSLNAVLQATLNELYEE